MATIPEHPLRLMLAQELHARPFPSFQSRGTVAFMSLKQTETATGVNRSAEQTRLITLLDYFGARHPGADATHYFGRAGNNLIKWEQHTEFVTYTLFIPSHGKQAFDPAIFDIFPQDWVATLDLASVSSAILHVDQRGTDDETEEKLTDWFDAANLAASRVLDDTAVIATDFRIDEAGYTRFALFVDEAAGPLRIGRIAQRLLELETYKSMSMLGFARARDLAERIGQLDRELLSLMDDMTSETISPEATLRDLLRRSSELEQMSAQSAYRFGATEAYEAIVKQRIAVLREQRFCGRQTFHEFMMRRYDPAMRTVKSTQKRLAALADRALRAGNLLRTRVDVQRSEQNQQLLASMNRRADLQLRLQKTVEGLSVVAISYYAVSLGGYLLYPLSRRLGFDKGLLLAALTVPVAATVWWSVRKIRKQMK